MSIERRTRNSNKKWKENVGRGKNSARDSRSGRRVGPGGKSRKCRESFREKATPSRRRNPRRVNDGVFLFKVCSGFVEEASGRQRKLGEVVLA